MNDLPRLTTRMERAQALTTARAAAGAEAVSELPCSVRVGAHDITIQILPHHQASARGEWGYFQAAAQLIVVQDQMPTAAKAVDTVLHEIGHALWWSYTLEDADKEERIVSTQATGWAQIFRDNPALVAWIAKWCTSDAE